jgi:hypothetical protein
VEDLMTLIDPDVAELARRAVDQHDPTLKITVKPGDLDDPYRLWGTEYWLVYAGGASSYIAASLSAEEAYAKLLADLFPASAQNAA